MPMRTFAAALLLASGFAGIVAADFVVTSLAADIFYRTAELYTAGGQLAGGGKSVSTVSTVVVETQAEIRGLTR